MTRRALLAAAVLAVVGLLPAGAVAADPPAGGVVALHARVNDRFVTAGGAGADPLQAARTLAAGWELFDVVVDPASVWVALRSHANNRYVSAGPQLVASRDTVGDGELFQLQARPDGAVNLFSKGANRYVAAENAGNAPLVANRTAAGAWEAFDITTEGGRPVAGSPFTRPTAMLQAADDDGQVDVQPLGDSWTGGNEGCAGATPSNWRGPAAARLVGAIPRAFYVGATQQGCTGNTWNSGWPGRTIADGLAGDTYRGWLTGLHPTGTTPDVVVLELGINDFWAGNCTATDCLNRIDDLVGRILAFDFRIRIIVCDVPMINLAADRRAEIAAYDTALPSRLAHHGATRVGTVSLSAAWSPGNTSDGGFHPNSAGYAQVAGAILDSAAWADWYGVRP